MSKSLKKLVKLLETDKEFDKTDFLLARELINNLEPEERRIKFIEKIESSRLDEMIPVMNIAREIYKEDFCREEDFWDDYADYIADALDMF